MMKWVWLVRGLIEQAVDRPLEVLARWWKRATGR